MTCLFSSKKLPIPACVRIILHNYNHKLPEKKIARACQVNRRGARFEHVEKFVRSIGFEITRLKDAGLNDLFDYLSAQKPVIVALGAEHLPYARSRTTHAVVVCGLDDNDVLLIDPAFGKEIRLETLAFHRAWTARGRSGLVIEPKS